MPDIALKLENLYKKLDGICAVDKVSIDIYSGEKTIGIVGQNGAGKSTLINLISGVLHPDAGSIKFRKREIASLSPVSIAKMGIIRTFLCPRIMDGISVADNIELGRYGDWNLKNLLQHFKKGSDNGIRILDMVKLKEKANVPVKLLTPSEKRRVELARALSSNPRVLLLDEPCAGASRQEKEEIFKILKSIHDSNMNILLIEHDFSFVSELVERLIVMAEGKIIYDGLSSNALQDKEVRDKYFGNMVG